MPWSERGQDIGLSNAMMIGWLHPIALGLFLAIPLAQAAQPSIDGLWLTNGYGQVVEIKQNVLRMYEITGASCIPAGMAKRRPGAKPGEVVFAGGSVGTLRITQTDTPAKLSMNADGVSNVELERTP